MCLAWIFAFSPFVVPWAFWMCRLKVFINLGIFFYCYFFRYYSVPFCLFSYSEILIRHKLVCFVVSHSSLKFHTFLSSLCCFLFLILENRNWSFSSLILSSSYSNISLSPYNNFLKNSSYCTFNTKIYILFLFIIFFLFIFSIWWDIVLIFASLIYFLLRFRTYIK